MNAPPSTLPRDAPLSPRTYTQVLLSPPSTPKRPPPNPLPSYDRVSTSTRVATPAHPRPKATAVEPNPGRDLTHPGESNTAKLLELGATCTHGLSTVPETNITSRKATTPGEREATPLLSQSEYHFSDLDMRAFEDSMQEQERRYGTPTSEDWRNLSVHANGSVASEELGGAIAMTVRQDEVDLEHYITNGIDRFGETIPGMETDREEYLARKRQRTGTPPPDTQRPRPASIRFRKYRSKTATAAREDSDQPPIAAPNDMTSSNHPESQHKGNPGKRDTAHHSRLAKGKAVDMATPTPSSSTAGIGGAPSDPWGDMATSMDIDNPNDARRISGIEQLTNVPSLGPSTGSRAPKSSFTLTPAWVREQMERTPQRGTCNEKPTQGEVLPSFLTQQAPPKAERRAPATLLGPQDWLSPQVVPAIPGADGYGFTPSPEGGFPTVHQPHPEGLIEDLAMSRVDEAWRQPEGTVLFVQVANVSHPDVPMRKPIHDEIFELIKHVTGESDFVPIAPQPEWVQPPRRAGAPKTWTILGLKKTTVADLVEMKVLSSVWITLFLYERKLVIPRYLFTLAGYTTNHANDIVESIKGAFLNEPIFATIEDLVQSHPGLQHLATHDAAYRIASSVEVRIDQLGNGNMQAAIFCDSPTGCGEDWKQWRASLAKLPFQSRYNPTAVARRPDTCLCCHSADHLTHKCPFPHIPGWNAPPPMSRTYGQPRQAQPASGGLPPQFPQPGPVGAQRGRGRGLGASRGDRSTTPARPRYYDNFQ